jgi:deoxycytidylate deaminase
MSHITYKIRQKSTGLYFVPTRKNDKERWKEIGKAYSRSNDVVSACRIGVGAGIIDAEDHEIVSFGLNEISACSVDEFCVKEAFEVIVAE